MILRLAFVQVCAFECTKVKRCFGGVFYHFTNFGFKNAKINFLKKIRVLSAVLSDLNTCDNIPVRPN